jgi:shikimate dehydrogenase
MSGKLFGLIGRTLKHTFSPSYFTDKFKLLDLEGYNYTIFEFENPENIAELKTRPEIAGLNVTIPYKESILLHLDAITEDAFNIGAVNTVKVVDGHWAGYNTDVMGFSDMLSSVQKGRPAMKKALILGSGGASKAVQYVCEKRKISYQVISRKGKHNYESLTKEIVQDVDLIVNTTPLGMYPNVDEKPNLDYNHISEKHSCIDLIYNPEKTLFLKECEANGALIKNGHEMLIGQAEHSWKIWNQP